LKQYTDRTLGAVERLEAANAELVGASAELRRRGDELALLSDLGRLAASEPRASTLPALVANYCVPALGEACTVVWRGSAALEQVVSGAATVSDALAARTVDEVFDLAARIECAQP